MTWPIVFELDLGETFTIESSDGMKVIKLLSCRVEKEPDYWNPDKTDKAIFTRAYIGIDISGVQATLIHQPFQMPVVVNGVSIYIETIKDWALHAEIDLLNKVKKTVRFSALRADNEWGPGNFIFPIARYRWRASTFNNTWSALVPYDLVYYHRGEDYAAIPDKLDVLSALDGKVIFSPFEDRNGWGSNTIAILHQNDFIIIYGHMNIGSINTNLLKGYHVKAGEKIGQVGCSWLNEETGHPHIHISLHRSENLENFNIDDLDIFSIFPMLVSSYFRTYPDSILPIAGGYRFTTLGKEIVLDGSLSLARPGRKIISYSWKLHDQTTVNSSLSKMIYDKPGLFSEELLVTADDGSQDSDFVQVRVYEPAQGRNIGYGDLYYFPNREIVVNQPVLFWIRLINIQGHPTIDFGDGSSYEIVETECTHIYTRPGFFTVTLSAIGRSNDPVTIKTRIIIKEE
jgi:murein DD-endopeptidase MepM/ murein hydrolase activator NlpD